MSQERLDDIKCELCTWMAKSKGSKRELLSLLGKLVFLGRVIKAGRIFTKRLFQASCKLKFLHHRIRLNKETIRDIEWWLFLIDNWNRKSLFYDEFWTTNFDIHLHTDASNKGYGAIYKTNWFSIPFSSFETSRSIAWRELLAVVTACATWGNRLAGRRLLIFCDKSSIVNAVNNGTSGCPALMTLICSLFLICGIYGFDCRLRYIESSRNVAADLLSRRELSRFHQEFPEADLQPTEAVTSELFPYDIP